MWSTRLWALVDLDEMEDLTFRASADEGRFAVRIDRSGTIYYPWRQRVDYQREALASSWGPVGYGLAGLALFLLWPVARRRLHPRVPAIASGVAAAGLLLVNPVVGGVLVVICLLAIIALPSTGDTGHTAPPVGRWGFWRGALTALGLGVFGFAAFRLLTSGGTPVDEYRVMGYTLHEMWQGDGEVDVWLLAAGHLAWLVVAAMWLRDGLRATAGSRLWVIVPWLCLMGLCVGLVAQEGTLMELHRLLGHHGSEAAGAGALLVGLVSEPGYWGRALSLVTLAAVCLLATFSVFGGYGEPAARRHAHPMAFCLIGLAFLTAVVWAPRPETVQAGGLGYIATPVRELDEALKKLDDMLRAFRDTNGCYPVALGDMLGSAVPTSGVDSSGNQVEPLRTGDGDGPLGAQHGVINELPTDPLTGRADTWVYEPTGAPMVDSGGYRITLRPRRLGRPALRLPTYYSDPWRGAPRPLFSPLVSRPSPTTGPPAAEPPSIDRPDLSAFVLSARHEIYRVVVNVPAGWARVERGDYNSRMASGPDKGQPLFYAQNHEHSTHLMSLSPSTGERRRVLDRPWRVRVDSTADGPLPGSWLIVAHDLEDEDYYKTQIYTYTPGSEPRAIGEPGYWVQAQRSPEESTVYAWRVDPPDPRVRFFTGTEGELWQIPADGSGPGRLIGPAMATGFREGHPVRMAHGEPSGVHWLTQTPPRVLPLPGSDLEVLDVWMDGRMVLLMGTDTEVLNGHPRKTARLWRWFEDPGAWTQVAQWPWADTTPLEKIAGYDAVTGSLIVLTGIHGDGLVLAIRPNGIVQTLRNWAP